MIIDDKIKVEKLQYDINREAAKISAFSSGKIDIMNILLVKKYHHPINNKYLNRLNLLILPWEKLLRSK